MNGCSGSSGYVAVVAGSESGRRMAQKMENDASSTSAGLYHFRPEHYLAAVWSRGGKTVQNSEKTAKSRHSNMPNREIKNEPQAKLKNRKRKPKARKLEKH